MTFADRMEIEKRHHQIVLEQLVRGQFGVGNLAEDTCVGHPSPLVKRNRITLRKICASAVVWLDW